MSNLSPPKRPMHAGNIDPKDVFVPTTEQLLGLDTFRPQLFERYQIESAHKMSTPQLVTKINERHVQLLATSTQIVGDSISPDIPTDGSYRVACGYVTGNFSWPGNSWSQYTNSGIAICGIDVWAENAGTAEDCEPGNASPSAMPGWANMRRAANVDPTVYTGQNNGWWACIQEFENAGVAQPHWWVANYTFVAGPIPVGAIGLQYSDQGGNGAWDISIFIYPWPGVQSAAPAPPAPPTSNNNNAGAFMIMSSGRE